jgi:hypothetical protein
LALVLDQRRGSASEEALIVLLAFGAVIAGFWATTSSAILVDPGVCRVYHIGFQIYDAGCGE